MVLAYVGDCSWPCLSLALTVYASLTDELTDLAGSLFCMVVSFGLP